MKDTQDNQDIGAVVKPNPSTLSNVSRDILPSWTDRQFRDAAELAAHKARPVFHLMGWTWHDKGSPTLNDITDCLERLLNQAFESEIKDYRVSTGRFTVEKSPDEEGTPIYSIHLDLWEGSLIQDEVRLRAHSALNNGAGGSTASMPKEKS